METNTLENKKRGPKPKNSDEKLDYLLRVCMKRDDKAEINAAAKRAHLPPSTWARVRLMQAADKQK